MTRPLAPRAWLGLAALVLGLAAAPVARAQVPERLAATVTQIAGADAYLDVGRDDGLAAGDTLRLWRDGAPLGRMRVASAASGSALVTPIAETFALTRGETVEVELPLKAPAPPLPAAPPPAVPERASILGAPEPPARDRASTPVWVAGRVQLGADALASTTAFAETETRRQFATPFAALRADITGLPGRWRARVHGRARVRTQDGAMVADGAQARVYALSVERELARARVRLGRFVPRRERFTGAWDGADVGLGTDALGGGVVAGWRPAQPAGLPDGARAGAVAYGHAARALGAARLRASASGGAVWDGEALPFAGASASASGTVGAVRLRLTADALADAAPDAPWELARAALRLSASPSSALSLRAYARQYRPSVADGSRLGDRFRPSRAVGGGASLRAGPALLRADVALRGAGGDAWSRSVSGGARLDRLGRLPLGLDASATRWTRGGRDALYATAGLRGRLGGARGTLGYRVSRTPVGEAMRTTHGLDAGLHAPLTRRLALALRVGASDGGGLGQTRLYSALWYRL